MSFEEPESRISTAIDFRRYVRGTFLEDLSEMEFNISTIIAMYFSEGEKKQNEFLEIVLERATLGIKIQMLEKILQNNFGDFLNTEPEFMMKLKGINSFRTKMAHAVGNKDNRKVFNSDDEYITIATFKNGKMIEERITVKEITEKQNDVYYIGEKLQFLWIAFLLPKEYSTRTG